jgi:hypothetical protein
VKTTAPKKDTALLKRNSLKNIKEKSDIKNSWKRIKMLEAV